MENIFELDNQYILHNYGREKLAFKRGKNATLFTETEDYIDFGAGIAVVSVGHGNERLAEAICNQARNLIHTSNLYYIEPQALLAKKLVELSGIDGRCFFCNSGAEANEAALKIARKYGEVDGKLKRYRVITLEHSFHGRTISTLKATGQESMHHNYFGPYPDGFVYAKNVNNVLELIDDHTVAVMLELVQGEGGIEPFDRGEIQQLAKDLKAKDVLLIVDEIQTGMYRGGEMLVSQLYDIQPDVVTLAKGLAGGVPVGAVITTLKDIFAPGDHGSTFGGNFLAMAASLEVIDILEEFKSSGELDNKIIKFEEQTKAICKEFPDIFEREVGVGLMRGLRTKSAELQKEIIKKSLEKRVVVLKAGRNTVRFLPPLSISKEEMDEGFTRFREALASL